MSEDRIQRKTALKIIQTNPELSEEEKNFLLRNGTIYQKRVNEILENTPLSEDEKEVIQQSIRYSGLRGPTLPIVIKEEIRAKLLKRILNTDDENTDDK